MTLVEPNIYKRNVAYWEKSRYDVRLMVAGKERWIRGLADIETARATLATYAAKRTVYGSDDMTHSTLRGLFDAYIGQITRRKAIRDTERFADWWCTYLPGDSVRDLTADAIIQARSVLAETGGRGGRGPATVNRYMAALRGAMKFAADRHWVEHNPTLQIKDFPEPSAPEYELSAGEETRLYQYLDEDGRRHVRLAIITGLRRSEQFSLRREWLNLYDGYIRLPETKAGGAQTVFLCQEARALLEEARERSSSELLFEGVQHERFYRKSYKPALSRIGHPQYTWHTLRHTFCSRLARHAPTFADLMAGGRWKDPKTALRYWHTYHAQVHDAIEKASSIGYLPKP
mgnify:CR=1 FL=1